MEEKWYPYRFKTKEEFQNDYGISDNGGPGGGGWRTGDTSGCAFISAMDYLLGTVYPFNVDRSTINAFLPGLPTNIPYSGSWTIWWFMLTENKPKVPNYKPKKIERTL